MWKKKKKKRLYEYSCRTYKWVHENSCEKLTLERTMFIIRIV